MRYLIIVLMLFLAPLAKAEDPSSDSALQSRLTAIYSSTTNLSDVTVSVENGVVTLTGDIANSALAEDAVSIAQAQSGTVYVQDQIDRVLGADNDVAGALGRLQKDATNITRALPIIALALIVFAIFIWLGGVVSRRKKFWSRIATNPFLGELLSQTARVVFVTAGLVLALNLLGAEALVATVLGGAGVAGIAIGFAVRDTLENYFASIMLSLRQPFRGGDHVLIEGHEGKVMRLTSRATILMTLDGNHLRIPNSTVFKSVILNFTTNPERRFDFELGVDAEDNPARAMQTGLDILRQNEFILDDPGPGAVIVRVGDSNIVIQFMGWVDQRSASFGKVRSLAIQSVKTALEDSGFSLPEPIYRVKLDGPTETLLKPSKAKSGQKPKPPTLVVQEVDVAPDDTIDEKIEEDLAMTGEHNLLDSSKPIE